MSKHRPHSRMPFCVDYTVGSVCVADRDGSVVADISGTSCNGPAHSEEVDDASYLAHAGNAYPKLIAFVQRIANGEWSLGGNAIALLREIGEDASLLKEKEVEA